MTRGDIVAAGICKSRGIASAMELFFLMKRIYPPYYKWTYRALKEHDDGTLSQLIEELSAMPCKPEAWDGKGYDPDRLNMDDKIVELTEEIAKSIVSMLRENSLIKGRDPYLEIYVNEVAELFSGRK